MEPTDKVLQAMLAKQNLLNEDFKNQPITREVDTPLTVFPELKVTGISRTEVVEVGDGEVIELRRFIDRKLYKMVFTKGLTMKGLIKWFNVGDELFMKCCF